MVIPLNACSFLPNKLLTLTSVIVANIVTSKYDQNGLFLRELSVRIGWFHQKSQLNGVCCYCRPPRAVISHSRYIQESVTEKLILKRLSKYQTKAAYSPYVIFQRQKRCFFFTFIDLLKVLRWLASICCYGNPFLFRAYPLVWGKVFSHRCLRLYTLNWWNAKLRSRNQQIIETQFNVMSSTTSTTNMQTMTMVKFSMHRIFFCLVRKFL